jgi:hypothetical protein
MKIISTAPAFVVLFEPSDYEPAASFFLPHDTSPDAAYLGGRSSETLDKPLGDRPPLSRARGAGA